MWAVVPVKDLANAKQRLADVLDPVERCTLFRVMLEDVLAALADAKGLDGLMVVTRDPAAIALAEGHGARVIGEDADCGHTAAVTAAARTLAAEGAGGLLTVPGDVPLVTPGEIEAVLAAHGTASAVTIVPARDEEGSNCIACSPPDAMPFRFGEDSFFPHLDAARRQGMEPRVLHLPGLGLDIDTAGDLTMLLARPGQSRAQAYVHSSGIAARLVRVARGGQARG